MGRFIGGCLLLIVVLIIAGAAFVIVDPLDWNLLDQLPINIGTTDEQPPLPTHTPAPNSTIPETEATVPVPITSSDNCEAVASASGVTIDADTERAEAPRTLPNGQPFPNKEPRGVGVGGGNANGQGLNNRTEVMIQFTADSRPNERNAYIRQIGGTSRRQIEALNTYIVILGPNTRPDRLPESPIVVTAEINETASATQEEGDPNDPRFPEQWGLPVVGLPEAWSAVPSGRTVIVAVIDSGICASHPDLSGRIIAGYDFVDDDNDPADVFGHGCSVAGVIAANANNSQGIAGVAPNVQIMPLRVLDAGGLGNYGNISSAIIYAADNGADIINLSLAGPSFSSVMEAAVAYAINKGVVVIAAAGNSGREGAFYPAAFPSVIAVGSIDPSLQRSSFSNYGDDIDVWAPGRDILTTTNDGGYDFESGTSFAAPIVAGITAMTETFDAPLNTEDGIVFLYPPDNIPDCDG